MTEKEAKSCIQTIELLRRLAFNVHGVMDVIDAGNCDKIIAMLSQEPCGDCISRTEAMRAITDEWVHSYGKKTTLEGFTAAIYNLPPVIPERDESKAESKRRGMKRTYDAEFFNGRCPYTDKPCNEWECDTCEVEEQEKKDAEELDRAESEGEG